MDSLVVYIIEFSVASVYCLLVGGLAYVFSRVYCHFYPKIYLWRDFWLTAIIISLIPVVFWLFPVPTMSLTVLDINQLQPDMQLTNQWLEKNKLQSSLNSYTLMKGLLLSWGVILLTGVLWMIAQFAVRLRRVNQIIAAARPVKQCHSICGQLHYKKLVRLQQFFKIKVVISDDTISPFAYQLKQPVLVFPTKLFSELESQQIGLIIRHEFIHLKRNDGVIVLLVNLLRCFVWFSPFIRYFYKQMVWGIEASCDSEVLSNKQNLRRSYAHAMLTVLRGSATAISRETVAAFSPKTNRNLSMRIKHIMNSSSDKFKSHFDKLKLWSWAAGIACVTIMVQPQLNASTLEIKNRLLNPVKQSQISSHYGANNRFHKFHRGIDLAADRGTPVLAVNSGVVKVSTDLLKGKKNYGTLVIIDHGNGLHSLYSHLNSRAVNVGEKVQAGQLIGEVGETGLASGPHLHLEILQDSQSRDPADYITFK